MTKKIRINIAFNRGEGLDRVTQAIAQLDYLDIGGETEVREAEAGLLQVAASLEVGDRLFLKNIAADVEKRTGKRLKILGSDVRTINEAIQAAYRPAGRADTDE